MTCYCKNSISKTTELSDSQTEVNDKILVTVRTREGKRKPWSTRTQMGTFINAANGRACTLWVSHPSKCTAF